MFHVPITKTDEPSRTIEFCHITNLSANPNTWEKGKYISLDNLKINIFVRGEFSLVLEKARFSPSFGDFCVFPPHALHYGSIPREMEIEYYQLDIGLSAFDGVPYGRELISELCAVSSKRGALVRMWGAELVRLCERIETAIADEDYPTAFALTVETVSKMRRAYLESTDPAVDFLSPRVLKTVEYIADNFSSPISIDALAGSLGVSTSYLSRRFKREVGTSIHAYVIGYRISESLKLLETHTIADTALSVGFCDSSHYISAFKRTVGCTPTEYIRGRKNNRPVK